MMVAEASYKIHLPQFEGPFDLLLFFIERDELDIHDIPISTITNDFLEYIHQMESLNIEVASEFILVAATLMKIKAKMLLPRPLINEAGQIEDPRTELVNRLLEYKRYKAVLEQVSTLEDNAGMQARRGFTAAEEKHLLQSDFSEEELVGLDLYAIMKAFRNVWIHHEESLRAPRHVIRRYPYTPEQLRATLFARLRAGAQVDFISFIMERPDKVYCVFGFLAVLELAQQKVLKVIVGEGYNNFWMVATGNPVPQQQVTEGSPGHSVEEETKSDS